ncbi:hypothetical protein ACIQYS_08150 [Psychrobacillus sp. NPDC096426]|uniref:hypothetical protein n=1 Tax=Psychrobacillus sp. NPDC096426 TaxID=3364491 RepID=UPI00382A0836
MIKKVLMLLLFSIFFLTACSGDKIMNFLDESDNWSVNYQVKKFDENKEAAEFTITYIGEEPTPKKIHYNLDYPSQYSLKIDGNSSFEGVLQLAGHSCDDCSGSKEDDEITVIITWDGKSELLHLKNQ